MRMQAAAHTGAPVSIDSRRKRVERAESPGGRGWLRSKSDKDFRDAVDRFMDDIAVPLEIFSIRFSFDLSPALRSPAFRPDTELFRRLFFAVVFALAALNAVACL